MQAILITAYKNYDHLERIIDFFDSNFSIYIHLDKKSQISYSQKEVLLKKKNVYYFSQEYSINWGGINHLKAILLLAKEALNKTDNTYFHLITGHDFPIKSLNYFKSSKIDQNLNYMEYHPLPYDAWPEGGLDRLSRYNLYDLLDGRRGWKEIFIKKFSKFQKMIGLKRGFYKNFPSLYGGSTYWSLNRDAISYIFTYTQHNPKFLPRFNYSFCSEEIFFQTILLNSPYRETIVNDHRRFIVWEKRNGNFPANLDNNDLSTIQESEALFARKFEFPVSTQLLASIQSLLKKDL